MRNFMKELTGTLLGINNINDDIASYKTEIINKVHLMNEELNISGESYRLRTSENNILMAPVTMPCLQQSEKLNFVYFGLNPGYGDDTYQEKIAAFGYDGGYYNFYNSYGIYDYLLESKENTYYQRVMKVMYAIFEESAKDSISIGDIRKAFGYNNVSPAYKYDHLVFRQLTKDQSIAFPELIPFHSQKFSTSFDKIKDKLEHLDIYKNYLDEMLTFIKNNLSEEGIVIANGKPVMSLLEESINKHEAIKIYEDVAIKVYKINKNLWIMFKLQLGAAKCKLNKAENIKMFGDKIKEIKLAKDYDSIDVNHYIVDNSESIQDYEVESTISTRSSNIEERTEPLQTIMNIKKPGLLENQLSQNIYDYLVEQNFHVYHATNSRIRCNPIKIKDVFPICSQNNVKGPVIHFEINIKEDYVNIAFYVFDTDLEEVRPFIDKMLQANLIKDTRFIGQKGKSTQSRKINFTSNEHAIGKVILGFEEFFDLHLDTVLNTFL